jgi:predicted nucleic acid-binding protein
MDRLFLDANVLFSAAYRPDAGLVRLWNLKDTALCTSRYALEEARANLEEAVQHRSLIRLSETLQSFEAERGSLPPGISLPEKDVPILLAALGAGASHLLTGDIRHFGAYLGKKIEGMTLMLPGEYLKIRTRER